MNHNVPILPPIICGKKSFKKILRLYKQSDDSHEIVSPICPNEEKVYFIMTKLYFICSCKDTFIMYMYLPFFRCIPKLPYPKDITGILLNKTFDVLEINKSLSLSRQTPMTKQKMLSKGAKFDFPKH